MTETNMPEEGFEKPSWLYGTFEPDSDEDNLDDKIAQDIACDREKNDAIRLAPDHVKFGDSVRVKYADRLCEVVAAVQSWQAPEDHCEFDCNEEGTVAF